MSGTASVVLSCYAPPPLSEAFRRAATTTGDRRDVLGKRIAFVDVTVRFASAVLICDATARGLQEPPRVTTLLSKLSTPSMGDWLQAASETAKLLARVDDAFSKEWVALFWAGNRRARRTATSEFLEQVIKVRNAVAHDDGSIFCNEADAAAHVAALAEGMKGLLAALSFLREQPLLLVNRLQLRRDGVSVVHLARYRGRDVDNVTVTSDRWTIPEQTPFLIGRGGSALLLDPWLVANWFPGESERTTRLLSRWNEKEQRLHFSDPFGGRAAPDPDTERRGEARALLLRKDCLVVPALTADDLRLVLDPAPPEGFPTLANYDVEAIAGRGASGTVYAAISRESGTRVAVKVLHGIVAQDPVQRRRLQIEYDVMSRLRHPSIARVLEYREDPAHGPFIALEWIEGSDLDREVSRGPLPAARAVGLVTQVLHALSAAHDEGITHRDVKPANVLVDEAGNARLIDFGIAGDRLTSDRTRTMEAVGTVLFAAPEQLAGEAADERADIYSVGRLLEYTIAGRLRPPGTELADIPSGIAAVIRRATNPNREVRYPSARAMLDSLAEREQAGFAGAPVSVGDRLNESYEVHRFEAAAADGWAFSGVEVVTEVAVGLVLVPRGRAERLRQSCADRRVRSSVGVRAVLTTSDGLVFAVISPRDAAGRGAALLHGRPYVAHGQLALFSRPRIALDSSLAPYLKWTSEIQEPATASAATEVVRLLGLILVAQLAEMGESLSLANWVDIADSGWARAIFDEIGRRARNRNVPREVVSAISSARGALRVLIDARNLAAHDSKGVPDSVWREVFRTGMEELTTAVQGMAAAIADRSLAPRVAITPWVTEIDSTWLVLDVRGSKLLYRELSADAPFGARDVPAPVIEELAKRDDRQVLKDTTSRTVRRQIERLEDNVRTGLGQLPFAARVEASPTIEFGARRYRPTFLVRAGDERPIVVIEVSRVPDRGLVVFRLEQLWAAAYAANAPYAAVTDGDLWKWYRVERQQGLVEMEEGLHGVDTTAAGPRD